VKHRPVVYVKIVFSFFWHGALIFTVKFRAPLSEIRGLVKFLRVLVLSVFKQFVDKATDWSRYSYSLPFSVKYMTSAAKKKIPCAAMAVS
jgi:hypothetical protein